MFVGLLQEVTNEQMRGVMGCSGLGGRAVVRAVGDSEWGFRLRHDLLGLITGPQTIPRIKMFKIYTS